MPAKRFLRRIKRVTRTNPIAVLLVLTLAVVGVFSIYFANTALQQRQNLESDAASLDAPLVPDSKMLGRGRLGENHYTSVMRALSPLNVSGAGGYSVFTVPCTVKVLPDTPIPTQDLSGPIVKLAKNETRCFQISIKSQTNQDLPTFQVISPTGISTKSYIEGFVTIETPSLTQLPNPDVPGKNKSYRYSNYTGKIPDPLIPLFNPSTDQNSIRELERLRDVHSTLPANITRTILIEVTTTSSISPGPKTLTIKLGQKDMSVPITVYDFALPDQLKLKTSFGTSTISRLGKGFLQHKVTSAQEKMRLMSDYYHEDLKWFGIDSYTPYWPEILYGQSVYGGSSRNNVLTTPAFYTCPNQNDPGHPNGVFTLSADIEREMRKFVDGKDENGNVVRRPASSFQITHLGRAQYANSGGMTICGKSWDQPGWDENAAKFVRAMKTYFDSRGWSEKAFYNIDEPPIEARKATDGNGVTIYRPLPLSQQVEYNTDGSVKYDSRGNAIPNGFERMWRFSKAVLDNTSFKIGSTTNALYPRLLTDDRVALTNSSGIIVPGRYPFNNPIPSNDLRHVASGRGWYQDGFGLLPGDCANAPSYQKRCLRSTDEPWFYYVNDPAFDLESVAQDQIMLGWTSYKYRQAGVLFWATNYWGGSRPNDTANANHPEYAGDYFLNPWTTTFNFYNTNLSATYFYPPCGTNTCANATFYTIPSLRLAFMREGIEDYEYLYQLEKKSNKDRAMAVAGLTDKSFINATAGWTDSPVLLQQRRDAIVDAITHGVPDSHLTCVNSACVNVVGPGVNSCTGNSDCGSTPQTHLVCQNAACVSVSGAGTNECASNADCTTPATHLECSNNQCVSVNGAGSNLCTTNADCSVPPEDIAYTVKKTTRAPILDGKLPEYTSVPAISFNGMDVYPVWNGSGLYLGVQVSDSTPTAIHTSSSCANGSESDCAVWRDDSFEWFVDMLNDKGGQANRAGVFMRSDDYHGIVNTNDARIDNRGDNQTTKPNFQWNGNWQSEVVKTDAGYTMEVFIPWSTVGTVPDGNSVIGFGLARNDATGSAVASKLWKERGSNFQNASNWNPIKLSSDTVTLSPTYVARNQDFTQNSNEWTFWKRDNTFAAGDWGNGAVRLTATQDGAWTCWFQDIDVKQYQGKKAIISGRVKGQSFDSSKPLPYIAFNAQDSSGVWTNNYGGSVTFPANDSYVDIHSNAISIGNSIEVLKAKVCMSDAKSGSVLISDSIKVEVQN